MEARDPAAEGASPEPSSPARGRPPSRDTERAILKATAGLLAERSLSEISLDDVAARGRVSKASIYRRWPSKGTLAFEAFMNEFVGSEPDADTGRLEGDLLAALRAFVRTVDGTTEGRILRALIAEVQRDPELADAWRERFVAPVRAKHLVIAERAIARGELSAEADTDLLLDLVYGPAYHRMLHGHLPLDDAFVTGVVRVIAAALEAGAL